MTTREMADSIHAEVEALVIACQEESASRTSPSHTHSDAVCSARDHLCETVVRLGHDHPADLSEDRIHSILRFAERPLFLTGVHKSGTTLFRNLFDGHSQLAVLPMDGGLSYKRMARARKADPNATGRDVLQRFLLTTLLPRSPVSGRRAWVLGSAPGDIVPYIKMARIFFSLVQHQEPSVASLFRALAGSYGSIRFGHDIPDHASWVYKSTLNIDEASDLAAAFEHARFLHIVRHPCAVYASQKKRQPAKGRPLNPAYELASLLAGMAGGLRNQDRLGSSCYRTLRYCDLVEDPQTTMRDIAAFAGIRYEAILCEPTDGGIPAAPNTGHTGKHTKRGRVSSHTVAAWTNELHPTEQQALKAYLGPAMALYGYPPIPGETKGVSQSIRALSLFYRGQEDVRQLRLRDVLSLRLRHRLPGASPA